MRPISRDWLGFQNGVVGALEGCMQHATSPILSRQDKPDVDAASARCSSVDGQPEDDSGRRDGRVSPTIKAPVDNRSRFQGASNNSYNTAPPIAEAARLTQTESVKANMSFSTLSRFLIEEGVVSRNQLATALSLKMCQGDSATNEVRTSSIAANSSAPLQDDENRLAEALVRTGALTAYQLEPLLTAYSRGADGASEFVSALLSERPHSGVLQVITNQLIRSLMNAVFLRSTERHGHKG